MPCSGKSEFIWNKSCLIWLDQCTDIFIKTVKTFATSFRSLFNKLNGRCEATLVVSLLQKTTDISIIDAIRKKSHLSWCSSPSWGKVGKCYLYKLCRILCQTATWCCHIEIRIKRLCCSFCKDWEIEGIENIGQLCFSWGGFSVQLVGKFHKSVNQLWIRDQFTGGKTVLCTAQSACLSFSCLASNVWVCLPIQNVFVSIEEYRF